MPILRQGDQSSSISDDALQNLTKQNAEVFYDEGTGFMFTEYEKYLDHVALQAKPIWTCRFTGKSDLTYSQALQSEKEAETILMSFPDCWKAFIFGLVQFCISFHLV